MSTLISRRIFAHFCNNHLKKSSMRSRIVSFSSIENEKSSNLEENAKSGMPASEPGKICAAVLKKFSDPLILENIESPKILQANEVSLMYKDLQF